MSLSTYYLEYGRHVARLRRRRRRRRRAYAPTSNTASHDNHEKINPWVFFSFLYEYGAPLGGPSGRRSSAIISFAFMTIACSFRKLFKSRANINKSDVAWESWSNHTAVKVGIVNELLKNNFSYRREASWNLVGKKAKDIVVYWKFDRYYVVWIKREGKLPVTYLYLFVSLQ